MSHANAPERQISGQSSYHTASMSLFGISTTMIMLLPRSTSATISRELTSGFWPELAILFQNSNIWSTKSKAEVKALLQN